MTQPRVLVLRAPGTNCDRETVFAFEQAGGQVELVHINQLLDNAQAIAQFQILCLPGGFSYGDDIAAGRILANQIRHHLVDVLHKFKDADKLVLGICNGFQILIKSGLLLESDEDGSPLTLTWNDSDRFEDRWVNLASSGQNCVFLNGADCLYLPVAHAEGKVVFRDHAALTKLQDQGQLVLRYTSAPGVQNGSVPYPANPNGSQANVAGVCNSSGRVFGLMPHPERFIDPTHHPRWTRGSLSDEGDGMQVFRNAIRYFE